MELRKNISMMRLGRCAAFLAAAVFLLQFTIRVMVSDQQYNLAYTRVFNEESDFYKFNRTYNVPYATTPLHLRSQFISENGTYDKNLLTREKFLEVGARMERRKEYLRRECIRLNSFNSRANAYEYLVNRQYHVIWCNVFKAASTSWLYNFNLMANYSALYLNLTNEIPRQLARRKYSRPSVADIKKAQSDSITFIIVRHPLERLVSAYYNRIVYSWPNLFHDNLGMEIIKKYRKDAQLQWTELYPLFEEFVMYLVDEWKAKRALDNHWTPYTGFCTPCKFNFDAILKFETLDEDQRYLIQLAHLQNIVKPEWKNRGQENTLHDINQLYSRIKKSQLDSLLEVYKYDFLLFNYTIENYYEIVKADETGS